jgi:tRNA pseudouridine55 synthase
MIDGLLLLDKPSGWTSHDLVNKIRKIFAQKRVGHTGILDPQATGLMVILLGKGTLFSPLLTGVDKKYLAEFRFGRATDSFDGEGTATYETNPGNINLETFRRLCESYRGEISQLIPPFSAVKVDGKRMYKISRAGKPVARKYKNVEIYVIDIISFDWPDVKLNILCSAGTYVRSLAHEMGEELGCGGYLKSLVRTAIGNFSLDDAVTVDKLAAEISGGDYSRIIPLAKALPDKPKISIRPEYCRSIIEGRPFVKKYLYKTDYKGPGGCLSLLLGPENKVLAMANLNYSWGSFNHLGGNDLLGRYVRIIDEGHLRQERA